MLPKHLLPPPLRERRGIPFYYDKTEAEFRRDVYERYDELVTRQTALHLHDDLHGGYPFADLLAYARDWLPPGAGLQIAELGCSVGRIAAELATGTHRVYGLDFSYQMIRQATDYWLRGREVRPNLARYGWGTPLISPPPVRKDRKKGARTQVQGGIVKQSERCADGALTFALADAAKLPFPDASLDAVVNTFLLDRLPHPGRALVEWARVLRPGGRLIVVSPLNFLTPAGWRDCHPPVKILAALRSSGWQILDWTDPLEVFEPMDARGNGMHWKCLAFVAEHG